MVDRNLTWEKDSLFVGAEGLGKCLAFVRQPQPQRQMMQMLNQLLLSPQNKGISGYQRHLDVVQKIPWKILEV